MIVVIIQKRKKIHKRRHNKKNYVTLVIILFLLIIMTVYFVLFTDFFNISKIEVHHNKAVSSEEIILKSTLRDGQNIFRFNKKQVVNAVEKIPYIKSASLVRVFPSTVKLYIEERNIIGAIFYENTFVFVDNEQVVLEVNQKLSNTTVPVITLEENALGTIVVGDKLQINPEWAKKEVFKILNIFQQEDLLKYISEVNITENNLFYLYTKRGSLIKVKNSDTVNEKLDFISTYLVEKDERMIVDLTHGGNPTYIPR